MNKMKFKRIFNVFWALPIALIWRISYFIHNVNLIKIRSDRIGHFAPDGAEQVARYQLQKNKKKIFCFDQIISNKQWALMLKRKLPIINILTYVHFWNNRFPGSKLFTFNGTNTKSRDIYQLYKKTDVKINFTQEENNDAIKWLTKFGWKIGEKFICLIVRDDKYLDNTYKNTSWNYHSYRNSNVNDYKIGVEWLIQKGFWVIRMGKEAEQELQVNSSRLIDFPFLQNKSDFIDIWLFANCSGCITSGTGPDAISHIYDKPCLGVNWLPLLGVQSYHNIITYPKYLFNKRGQKLSINQYLKHSYYKTEEYLKNDIKIKNLSSLQIKKAIEEFYYYKLLKKKISKNYKDQCSNFWNLVLKFDKAHIGHNNIDERALISESWLKSHKL